MTGLYGKRDITIRCIISEFSLPFRQDGYKMVRVLAKIIRIIRNPTKENPIQ